MSAAAFRACFDLHLRRRRASLALEGARAGGRRTLAAAALLIALVALGVLPPPGGPLATVSLLAALLVGGAAAGALLAVHRDGTATSLAQTLDAVLGREDLVATAAALASRPSAPGRFGAAVLERAAEEVGALAPDRIGPLPRPPWRLLGLAALVALLASLLPQGGFGILPGLGGGWGTGGRDGGGTATNERPGAREGGGIGAPPAGAPPKEAEPKEDPEGAPTEEPPAAPSAPERVASLELAALARSFVDGAPVTVGAVAEGGPGAGDGTDLALFVSVDGKKPAPEGGRHRVLAGKRTGWARDLRTMAPLLADLGPGTHRVEGSLRDAEGRTVAKSPEIEIVVEGGPPDSSKDRRDEKPKPKPRPEPDPAALPPGPGGNPPAPPPKEKAPPPPPVIPVKSPGTPPGTPPSKFETRLVRPLFGEGAEVERRGPVLVLDPEGSRGDPPRALDEGEALAEVRARAEEAARREGIDPRDREAVRRYFEALRRIVEGK